MSALEYNGAAVVAMAGKNCVAIASDLRLGQRFLTVSTEFQKMFQMHEKLFVGLAGLGTDVQTVAAHLKFHLKLYSLKEGREMKPSTFAAFMSSFLYERRFGPWFIEPVIAGLEGPDNTPFIHGQDLLGAGMTTKDFIVAGTCSDNLFGMCESLWRPDMNADELFETISQCLMSAVDRDSSSGWGGVVHIITPDAVITKVLKVRMD